MAPASTVHNVILFGEAGSGKSSIVNMIVGKPVARTSNSAGGCTFESEVYDANFHDNSFRIHDTAGLNEGEQGRIPHWMAIQNLYTLIRQLDGVSLLIYCMRGRIKENAMANWKLFNKIICGEKVPIIAVVTGLEEEENPDDWWEREENKDLFRRHQMNPRAVVCVVSFRGKRNQHEDIYIASQEKLRRIIKDKRLRKPWLEEKDKWFATIYENVYTTECFVARDRLDYSAQMRNLIAQFVDETGMEEDDCEKLESTLLKAEKKLRKTTRFKIPSRWGSP